MRPQTDTLARHSWPARLRADLRRRLAPSALVLLYHRILPEVGRDTNRLATSTPHFAAQLDWLGRHCCPLSLAEFLNRLQHPARSKWTLDGGKPRVLITFDDGYADNLRHALPVLSQFGLSAMVFVVSGLVGSNLPFWWDALEQIVFDGTPPEAWNLPDGSLVPSAGSKSDTFRTIHRVLKPLADAQRQPALADLATQANVTPRADEDARPMTWDELRTWVAAGMTVGGHTQTHPQLSALNTQELHTEIAQCKRDLQEQLDIPISTLAYPFGGRADYDQRCEQAAREASFSHAFRVGVGNAAWARSPYALPRCSVGNWPLKEFLAHFREWAQ